MSEATSSRSSPTMPGRSPTGSSRVRGQRAHRVDDLVGLRVAQRRPGALGEHPQRPVLLLWPLRPAEKLLRRRLLAGR
jgi:hypothetical protein